MKTTQHILKTFIVLLCILTVKTGFAQNVGISSVSGFVPDVSAALDVSYSSKGLLIPRVSLTATNAAGPITSPAISLLVYNLATAGSSPNNVIPGYYYWNGSAWIMLNTSAQTNSTAWALTGNSGTSYPTNYFGTTDNFGLHFKTAATHRLWIDSLGSVAVGTSPTFSSVREKFLVDAGTTSSYNVISGKGSINSYLQLNIQNTNAGAAASADVVASNDAATETTNYVDLGINSSANTSTGPTGGANTGYLLGAGNDFAIGNGTANKNLTFFTAGTTAATPPATQTYSERMRIDPTGNVGINNIAPTEKLDLTGNLRFSGALMPNNNAGIAGYFLVSSGAGIAPTWFNANTYAWLTTGNTGTSSTTNFLGTIDNKPMRFRTNNTQRMLLDSLGNVAIGASPTFSTNTEKFLVDAGTTSSYNVISGKGNLNSYLQLNIQNSNAGTAASSDVVATADNGTESVNYVDMGINSSANTANTFGGINDAYLYNAGGTANGGNFYIGTSTSGKSLGFLTGGSLVGSGTTTNNERMHIDGSGNVGIGTIAPTQKLDVNGSINAANSIYLDGANTNTGTLNPGLYFGGSGSGEVISSKRTTGTNQYGIDFYTSSNNRMTIGNTGNIGIGTTIPSEKLDVAGNLKFSAALMPNNDAGTSGYFLRSAGAGNAPVWFNGSNLVTSQAWGLTGNAGTVAGTNFIGTTDAIDFVAKTSNAERLRINSSGDVAIGGTAFNSTSPEQLLVDAGTTSSYNVISGKGSINNYLQLNIQNNNNGTSASSDVVATNDAGTDANGLNFIDMGVNSSTYNLNTNPILNGINNTYLYSTGNDMIFGNATAAKSLIFFTGGTALTNERMRISGTGQVGIGNINPVSTLEVNGSVGAAITVIAASATAITLDATNYTVILTATTPAINLPAASSTTNIRRIYVIVNETNIPRAISNYTSFTGATNANSIPANSSITVQSNGINWYRIQ